MSTLVRTPELHRLSIDEYHRLVASGGLEEGARVELIDGLVVDMSPKTPQHERTIRWLTDWVIDHLERARYQLMVGGPLTIGASEPEPDLAIIERAQPAPGHPSGAKLVIEVALSSGERDLRTKPGLYAPAVEEYWVVDLGARRLVVHRQPARDGYRETLEVAEGDALEARAVELGRLPVGELFAAAFAERRSPAA